MRLPTADPQGASNLNPALDGASIRLQLERVLASDLFQHSRRYPALLRYVVEHAVNGTTDELKERTLGVIVFKRSPEYDTSADPVVRTTASEVRKRLETYYSEPAHAEELRIALPVGTYIPEFRPAPELIAAPPPPPAIAQSRAFTGFRDWRIWAIAVLLLITADVGVALRMGTQANALHQFWDPVFKTPTPVLMVFETLMAIPKPSLTQSAAQVQEVMDPNLFLIVNEGNSRIAAYFSANGKAVEYELARNVTVAKMRTRPFILKGAFNNPLTWQAVASFRYALNLDRAALVRQIVDRDNPSRHWDAPMTDLKKDYALIARAPEPRTGQTMIVIAGLGERGGAAATEFLTNPKYMERFAAQAPRGWEHRNLEIVLETELANGDWGEPRMIANYVW